MTELTVPDIKDDPEWYDIVNALVDTLVEGGGVPDNVIEAAELMVSGWPTYKIARHLGVKTTTVKGWLTKYPTMAHAVATARQNVQKWRLNQLEQQFITAVQKSAEVLSAEERLFLDADGNPLLDEDGNIIRDVPNAKLLGVQAQHARYILGLFLGGKIDINVNVRDETPVMRARADALDYVVRKLADAQIKGEPRETVVIVQPPDKESGPLVNENDEPRFGKMGVIDVNEDGAQCHICGKRFERSNLGIHVRTKHGISNDLYEVEFMLSPGELDGKSTKVESGGLGGPSEA